MNPRHYFCLLSSTAISATCLSFSNARDLPAAYRIENLPAANNSIQTSFIFQTTPGVRYTVQRSQNLEQWIPDESFGESGEIYGLGHECVVSMREFVPPPSPPPGGYPPPSGPRPINVGIRLARCNDPGGGTIATWPSLTGSGYASVLIAQEMDDGWDFLPLYWHSSGNLNFFIGHSMLSSAAPVPAALSQQDQAVLNALESSFPAMNTHVDQQQALVRNSPPPAPPSPASRNFWRVKADWNVDTDADGSPDWAEFEMQGDPNHPFHALADAFNADVDNDGVADGAQLDLDGDLTPDMGDVATHDPVMTHIREPEPRYAIFPVTGTAPPANEKAPVQINDQGLVLYVNGIWSGDGWDLLADESGKLEGCSAYGMNDLGQIIGRGTYELQESPEFKSSVLVHWTSPSAQPAPVISGDDHAIPTYDMSVRQMAPGPIISNDGRVIAKSFTADFESGGGVNITTAPEHHVWEVDGTSSSKGAEAPGMIWIADARTYWGRMPDGTGKIFLPERELSLPFVPRSVVEIGPDIVGAFSPERTDIARGGHWQGGGAYRTVLKTSEEGVAIARHPSGMLAPVLLNGKWKQIIRTAAFDVPQAWRSSEVKFLDISSFGWILARKGPDPEPDYAALLPIRLESSFTDHNGQTVTDAAGVDNVSVGADQMDNSTRDRLWIMAPQGTTKTIRWTSPLTGVNPLKISGAGLKFGGATTATLGGYENVVNIQADSGGSGSEVLLDLELGQTGSISKPVGVKIMKQRTIRLAVYKVTKAAVGSDPAVPAILVPDEEELEGYLNDIYRPQLNASFDVRIEPTPLVVDWDIGTVNKSLDGNGINGTLTTEQMTIEAAKSALHAQQAQQPGHTPFNEHITLYLVGGRKPISTDAFGITSRQTKTCWVIGNFVSMMNSDTVLTYDPGVGHIHNIAHELGHVLIGPGHPDVKEFPGPAALVGTNRSKRLMESGSATGSSTMYTDGKVLVKGEWDEAEIWMAGAIDANP